MPLSMTAAIGKLKFWEGNASVHDNDNGSLKNGKARVCSPPLYSSSVLLSSAPLLLSGLFESPMQTQ